MAVSVSEEIFIEEDDDDEALEKELDRYEQISISVSLARRNRLGIIVGMAKTPLESYFCSLDVSMRYSEETIGVEDKDDDIDELVVSPLSSLVHRLRLCPPPSGGEIDGLVEGVDSDDRLDSYLLLTKC